MKRPMLLLWLCSIAGLASAQAGGYQVAGSVKTLTREKSDRQELPHGSTRLVQEEKVLVMEIRRVNPNAPANAEVRWMVLMEAISGDVRPAVHGKQQVATQVGIPVEVQSDSFTLREREFNGNGGLGSGSAEQKVKGYGVLVFDAEGNEMGSKFSATAVEAEIRRELVGIARKEKEAQEGGGQDPQRPPRARVPRLKP